MQQADTGSVVVTDDGKVVGILTERDLLRAAAGQGDPDAGAGAPLDDRPPGRARSRRAGRRGLGQPDLAPLPPPASGRRRPLRRRRVAARPHGAWRASGPRARRAATSRPGSRAWWWPRRRSATSAARRASSTTGSTRRSSWPRSAPSRTSGICCSTASSPTRPPRPPSATRCGGAAPSRRACTPCCRPSASAAHRSTCCAPPSRSSAAELGWRPTHDIGADELYDQALGLCAVVPTILAAAYRLRQGQEPLEPRDDLGFAANYLFMLTGTEPSARACPGH